MTALLYCKRMASAKKEIIALKGRITQIFTKHLFVAVLPDELPLNKLRYSTPLIPDDIDKISKIFVDAWNSKKTFKDSEIIKWDDKRFTQPKNAFNDPELRAQQEIFPSGTSSYLVGEVAVGLVIVSGKKSGLGFSDSEKSKVVSQVKEGLQRMACFEPAANVTFVYETSFLDIDAAPPTSACQDYESCEKIWRDPALTLLGCSTGLAGVNEYNKRLIGAKNTKWAFTAFFTKYPQKHFAYAGSGRVCMQYSNDNWGPDKIYQVFAHETGHIFGAADEYADSGCGCGSSGFLNVPNYNCENCNADWPKESCLMNNNDPGAMCAWSRGQLGWPYAAISNETASGKWENYYGTGVTFSTGGKSYLFAQTTTSDRRWFISELTPDGKGFDTELSSGKWGNYYKTAVVFSKDGKNYLFAQAETSDRRWFISELTPDGKGFDTELASGKWANYYGTAVTFASGGKNYLFAQTESSGKRWFISELTPDGKGFDTELSSGKWENYYGSAVAFNEGGKSYLFAQTTSSGRRWFISELTPNGKGFDTELGSGKWENYYGTARLFSAGRKNYLFAQTTTSDRRWFISELTSDGKGFQSELGNGEWANYYGTAVTFASGGKNYLFAQTESSGKRWFISVVASSEGML